MTFPTYYLLPFLLGIVLDIWFVKYQYTNKFLNYFLVFVMTFGHPLYFLISLFIAFFVNKNISGDPLFNYFTYIGYITLVLSASTFALLRFGIYYIIVKKSIKDFNINDLYQYCKFYMFTFFGIFLYLSTINMQLEFYLVYMFQVITPILIIFVIIYSVIKLLILKLLSVRIKGREGYFK